MRLSLGSILTWIVAVGFVLCSAQEALSDHEDDTDEIVDEEESTPMIPEGWSVVLEEDDDDGLYQRNPNYEPPTIDSVLGKNATYVERSVRRVARFLRKHRRSVCFCLGLYLLCRIVSMQAIKSFIMKSIVRADYDEQGKLVGSRWKTSEVMRIIRLGIILIPLLFFTMASSNNEDEAMPPQLATMLFGPRMGLATMVLRKLLRPQQEYNPAYIPSIEQHYTFELLNDRYSKDAMAMSKITKKQHSARTSTSLSAQTANSTIVVLDWTGLDTTVSDLDSLKDSVSFLLSLDDNKFDIVVVLESPGGSAARYAMAAQQLCRLRKFHDITICVDTVAASGGYMIACAGTRIIASPFAMLGSIGVVGQSVNVHKVLENWGIRPLVFRGGRDKAPLGLIGEVTDENLAKMQGLIDDTHRAFKRHVVENRPRLKDNIEEIATGDVWFGYDAVEVGLIDDIGTSDDYLLDRMKSGKRVLRLKKIVRKGVFGVPTVSDNSPKSAQQGVVQRFGSGIAQALLGSKIWNQLTTSSLLEKTGL